MQELQEQLRNFLRRNLVEDLDVVLNFAEKKDGCSYDRLVDSRFHQIEEDFVDEVGCHIDEVYTELLKELRHTIQDQ